jgi:hypothetical protein
MCFDMGYFQENTKMALVFQDESIMWGTEIGLQPTANSGGTVPSDDH